MKIQDIEISHPDKVLFPDSGITKSDLVEYYQKISGYMLPHIKDRPLTLRRYPHGIKKEGFYSKHIPDYYPDYIKRITVPMRTKQQDMMMACAQKEKDLIYFAGQDVIELHMSLSKTSNLENPDQMIFDFDPHNDFEKVRIAALELKSILDALQMPSFIKTTGSKGVHVHVPLTADASFSQIKECSNKIAHQLLEQLPEVTTLEQRKEKRGDKVFIDILRNDYGMTAIVPYSLRAVEEASIATPIDWGELKDKSLNARTYSLSNILRRLSQKQDPWRDFEKKAISYDQLIKALAAL